MAIYHLEAKVVSRGNGRSAVAASAYLSCSKILNDYDGVAAGLIGGLLGGFIGQKALKKHFIKAGLVSVK